VRAGNEAALELYRKFGFMVAGRRPKYYRDNGEDAILMTLQRLETA
jgi:[ribosomal protein S18]-alanine N-acetyltransferase